MSSGGGWLGLPTGEPWTDEERKEFESFVCLLATNGHAGGTLGSATRGHPRAAAACLVLADLVEQGWDLQVDHGDVRVFPPSLARGAEAEKTRVRKQELLKRTEQLRTPSVRRFVEGMEQPREHRGRFVSIYSLMRDGEELAESLATVEPDNWRSVLDPYVQVISSHSQRCVHTGFQLNDIWRYFRHTWANQYTSTPGRTMQILVRDRARPFHPVIGIAALGSAIVQIRERDEWLGWQSAEFLSSLAEKPTLRAARWVVDRLEQGLDEIYLDDLIADGLYWPSLWEAPTTDAIVGLRAESNARRQTHRRFARREDFSSSADRDWPRRASTDLFRSKRCAALADLLEVRRDVAPFLFPKPSVAGLRGALADTSARRGISRLLRRAKAEAVGTEIADLTVCGAVPPYNLVLGGKLVAMLSVSPTVVSAYRHRYEDYESVIASSMAGRPIRRRSNLVFVGTTSLYGSSSSQYNRLRIPAEVLKGSAEIAFLRLGKSRSFGTSHMSADTVTALVRLSQVSGTGIRINSIFGEGVNPKLRKVRDGLDLLGWPADELLQHRRQRIVYGVPLVTNLRDYLLGLDQEPNYRFRSNVAKDVERVSDWWEERWLRRRAQSRGVLEDVRRHTKPSSGGHGARVVLPPAECGED
jgi:hypothetical protein